jgi:hypothetical protein
MATVISEINTPDTGNTPNASGSFTPILSDLLIVIIAASETVTDPASSALTSSVGMTFTQIARATYRTSLDSLYMFVSNTLVSNAAAQTVSFAPADPASGTNICVVAVAGMKRSGLNAIRQFATQINQVAGTPAPAFSRAALTENAVIGAIGNNTNPATMTVPAGGWTENGDIGYITPTTGCEHVSRNSGFTGTTVTWGSASASTFASIIVELNTSEKDPYAPEMQRGPVLAQ